MSQDTLVFDTENCLEETHELMFTLDDFNQRLDATIAKYLSQYSRTLIQSWIKEGRVTVDGQVQLEAAYRLDGFEVCEVRASIPQLITSTAEDIPLDIVYEDDDILVINKPAGLVVHPGAGNPTGTLMNALLHHDPELNKLPRAGIVHRLDKDTSGLMVVAKNMESRTYLVEKIQEKDVTREYEAIAHGIITRGGTVRAPIGRHTTKRTAMAVDFKHGKPAVTLYRVMETYRNYTRLRLRLETGRTHQIRVHMSYLNHPLLGDTLYGGQIRFPKKADEHLINTLRGFGRQALHAIKLSLVHPRTQEEMTWEAPLPQDMVDLVAALQQDRDDHPDLIAL